VPEPVAKAIHGLRSKLRALCTLLRAAEVLESLGHTDVAMKILGIVDSCLSARMPSFSAEGVGGLHLATCSSESIAQLSGASNPGRKKGGEMVWRS